jgi:hypothetical protein
LADDFQSEWSKLDSGQVRIEFPHRPHRVLQDGEFLRGLAVGVKVIPLGVVQEGREHFGDGDAALVGVDLPEGVGFQFQLETRERGSRLRRVERSGEEFLVTDAVGVRPDGPAAATLTVGDVTRGRSAAWGHWCILQAFCGTIPQIASFGGRTQHMLR